MKIPVIHLKLTKRTDILGQHCIYIVICIQKKYIRRSTGVWVKKTEWDSEKEIIIGQGKEEKKRILLEKKQELEGKFINHIGPFTYEEVSQMMNQEKDSTKPNKDDDFIEYAHKVNNLFYGRGKYGYTSWYNKHRYIIAFASFIEKNLKMNRPRICEINLTIFDQYINYRINTRGNKNKEIINKSLVPLYAAVNYAERKATAKMSECVNFLSVTTPKGYPFSRKVRKTNHAAFIPQ